MDRCITWDCGGEGRRRFKTYLLVSLPSGRGWVPLRFCVCETCCELWSDATAQGEVGPGMMIPDDGPVGD